MKNAGTIEAFLEEYRAQRNKDALVGLCILGLVVTGVVMIYKWYKGKKASPSNTDLQTSK
ncbi:hypothetical protein IPH25_03560 [bacterium]|nr:MAG: hypothetical protein IPG37_00550 [bacterium]QQR61533.1 MAG: hypothetical protein IPH25_03560 [bacterium]QQR62938.1 MAG: hypothetical protein IPH67_00420 [bacterium]